MKIKLKQLDPDLPIPKYAHKNDAGCDLYSRIDLVLKPGERALMPTGIQVAIPAGYAGFIQPRSGIALTQGISIVNSPGIVDPSYRGEIKVILINLDKKKTFKLKRGEKICQLTIQKVEKVDFELVEDLDDTERGGRGFGSTGLNRGSRGQVSTINIFSIPSTSLRTGCFFLNNVIGSPYGISTFFKKLLFPRILP